MRIYLILTAVLVISALVIPYAVNTVSDTFSVTEAIISDVISEEKSTEEITVDKETVKVLKSSSGDIAETDMFEYIVGTVAGEMPASFCIEALKAQAVASYTYAKYIKENSEQNNAVLSDSSAVHQSYIDKAEQKEKWGEYYDEYRGKIEKAVKDVEGEYIVYGESTAMTVFHALSTDNTNSAEEIWGEAIPYLISVKAPGNEVSEKVISFTEEEFKKLFREKGEVVFEADDSKKQVKIAEKNDNGYIRKLTVCNKIFDATETAEILSLPSANFTANYKNKTFIFTVYGKGHGVGMSQYGAEILASEGKNYAEILSHFYPGTILVKE